MFGMDDLDLDLEGAPDNAFEAPDGTYQGVVSKFEFRDTKSNAGVPYKAFIFTLTPEDGGVPYDHFLMLPSAEDEDKVKIRKRSAIRTFLRGIGIPESRLDVAEEDDVITGELLQWELSTTNPNAKGKTYRKLRIRTVGNSSMETAKVESKPEAAMAGASASDESDPFEL